MVAIVIYFK